MKAIAIDDFGTQPTLHDLPVPEPGKGEVLVRVRASSVNGFDVAVAAGCAKGIMEHHFPAVLVSRGRSGVFPGQAGALQTVMTAWAVLVAMSRPAPGNAGRALALRARCRFRSVTVRHLLIALVRRA